MRIEAQFNRRIEYGVTRVMTQVITIPLIINEDIMKNVYIDIVANPAISDDELKEIAKNLVDIINCTSYGCENNSCPVHGIEAQK